MANLAPTKTKSPSPAPTPSSNMWPLRDYPTFVSQMQEEFNQLFDRFFHREWPAVFNETGIGQNWRWGVDVQDQDHAYVVRAEAPGFEASDFDLQVTGNRLVLKAVRKTESQGKKGEPQEWQEREYYQTVTLPGGIDRETAVAEYKNGILTVTLPKTEEGKGKKLAVKSS